MANDDLLVEEIAENLARYRGNYTNNSIVYKNIIPTSKSTTPNDVCENSCEDNLSVKAEDNCPQAEEVKDNNSAIWQMYMAYAAEALANITVFSNDCEGKSEEKVAEMAYQDSVTVNSTVNCDEEMKNQLNRIEDMLKEIHLCNQKLYKSLLAYCTNYNE